jgi:adenylate cyclase
VSLDHVERKLAAILSADVVGYSRLMAEDEAGTIQTLTNYRKLITGLVTDHHGRVVDAPGDNLLAEFPNALDAVQCAVEIQGVLRVRNQSLSEQRRMLFRIGVHLGDVTAEGERIYGDGVNIAARLEGLADPGGVCISGEVQRQVENRLDFRCEDLGEQSLKNIEKSVRVYRVRTEAGAPPAAPALRGGRKVVLAGGVALVLIAAALAGWRLLAPTPEEMAVIAEEFTVPGFGGAPAIAVLPFDNLSGDPEQEYFADGIAEDLITRLSAWRSFPVIARNSSFVYKGKPVDVKQVSRELGSRYMVEGSVRRAGDRIRISAQLIDATTGHHVWAETYDRELREIFALQDEITERVVASIYPELLKSEMARAARRDSQSLEAYDLGMRGLWHFFKFTKEDNAKARSLFERATESNPQWSMPFAGIAFTHDSDLSFQWTASSDRSAADLERAAKRCLELDDRTHQCYTARASSYLWSGQWEKAIADLKRAIGLNPSFALGYIWLGNVLSTHSPEEAIATLEKGLRLSPQDPFMGGVYALAMAHAHFAAERYREAADWGQRSLQLSPEPEFAYRVLVASYAQLGSIEEARASLDEWLQSRPDHSVTAVEQSYYRIINPDFLERVLEGLRMAGMPEE